MIIELNNGNFQEVTSSGMVLIDFWAAWCGPCRMLSPIVDEIASERPEVKVCKLNVDEFPEIAGKHNVMSIPTLVFMKDGSIQDTSIGVVSKSVLERKLEQLKG